MHIYEYFFFKSFKRNFNKHEISGVYTKLTKATTPLPKKGCTINM